MGKITFYLSLSACLALIFGLLFFAKNKEPVPVPSDSGQNFAEIKEVTDNNSYSFNDSDLNNNSTDSPSENPFADDVVNDEAVQSKEPLPSGIDKININNVRGSRIGQEISSELGIKSVIKKYELTSVVNDPYASQWWKDIVGVDDLWSLPSPKKQTLIAIVDTGIALKHEDLDGKWYQNPGETGQATLEGPSYLNCTDRNIELDASCNNIDDNVDGVIDNEFGSTNYENKSSLNCTDQNISIDKSCNRLDDDNNGYVDDVSGWDMVNQDNSPQAGELNLLNGKSLDHATMVAGIAAASANNSKGLAGIDWNAKILPLQALDDDAYGDSYTVGNSIRYAADMGADVINVSLGTYGPDTYILQAVEYAYDKGSIVVAAAGNDGCECMVYPANYEITVSVGALDNTGKEKTYFSSYGDNLDVMAPGQAIWSSTFSASNPTSAYRSGSGTSFATPLISGLLSRLKGQLPEATNSQIVSLLTEQAHREIQDGQVKSKGYGYGIANFKGSATRATNSKVFQQMYKLVDVTNGGVFYGKSNEANLYACETGSAGTTPIYKTKKSNELFSINPSDVRIAGQQSYIESIVMNACSYMPHDTIESSIGISLVREISNATYKSLLKF